MEVSRTLRVQDENVRAVRSKNVTKGFGAERNGLATRNVLRDVSNKLPLRPAVIDKKVDTAAAELEKKATIGKPPCSKVNSFKHVSSKIDTGLQVRPSTQMTRTANQVTRPTLRREESTAAHAIRAAAYKQKLQIHVPNLKKVDSKENLHKGKKDEPKELKKNRTDEICEEKPKLSIDTVEKFAYPKLPSDIEDFDADEPNSPLMLTNYIQDIYKYLRYMENKYSVRSDFIEQQKVITASMRALLVDWLVEVHTQFNLTHDTLQLTIGILDRFIQAKKDITKTDFQLIGISALLVASKYEEIYVPDINDFVLITDKTYTKSDLHKCEILLIKKLDFSLGKPLPVHFLRRFIRVARGNERNHHLAKYLVDLSLLEPSLASLPPSKLAAAAICLSIFLLSQKESLEDVWTPQLAYYSTYALKDIENIIFKVAKVLLDQEKSKLQAVTKRYKKSSQGRVSTLAELRHPIIKEMADRAS